MSDGVGSASGIVTDQVALPQEFVDAVARRARERGIDGDLAATFVRAVLRRLPTDLAEEADPHAAMSGVLELLAQVVASPGADGRHRAIGRRRWTPAAGRSASSRSTGWTGRSCSSTVLATLRSLGIGTLRALHPIIGVGARRGRPADRRPAGTDRPTARVHHPHRARPGPDRGPGASELEAELDAALADVEAATDDYHLMRRRMADLAERIRARHDLAAHRPASCVTRSHCC